MQALRPVLCVTAFAFFDDRDCAGTFILRVQQRKSIVKHTGSKKKQVKCRVPWASIYCFIAEPWTRFY